MQFVYMIRNRDGSTRVEDDSRLRLLFPEVRILEADTQSRETTRERKRGEEGRRQATSSR